MPRKTRIPAPTPDIVQVKYGTHAIPSQQERGYTYRNVGLRIRIGSLVVVPPPRNRKTHNIVGTVVAIGSDYPGLIQPLVRLRRF